MHLGIINDNMENDSLQLLSNEDIKLLNNGLKFGKSEIENILEVIFKDTKGLIREHIRSEFH